jgi:hypothetical protein
MENLLRFVNRVRGPAFAAVALLLAVGLMAIGCESVKEAKDNFDSRITSADYCAKKFDCAKHTPTSEETDACVSDARSSIEDNCGNEHQAAANKRIEECVDKGCGEFQLCMVFEAAPGCFGFVSH